MNATRIGTKRIDDRAYTGVLRIGRNVVAECGHTHTNRDESSRTGGRSATDCIHDLVRAAQRPSAADAEASRIAAAWQILGRRGFEVSASTIAKAKADAPAQVAAYRAKVAEVAALLAEHPLATRSAPQSTTQPETEVGELPAWMCG